MALSSVSNNPHTSWLEYLGLPEDLDEWTLVDVKYSVSAYLSPAEGGGTASVNSDPQTITLNDFIDYLRSVGEPYCFMAVKRPHQSADEADSSTAKRAVKADLSNVPIVCFEADFDLSKPETFAHFSPADQSAVGMVTLEKLGGYLDSVF